MAKRLRVVVDNNSHEIRIRRGFFGPVSAYGGGWYYDLPVYEAVAHFLREELS